MGKNSMNPMEQHRREQKKKEAKKLKKDKEKRQQEYVSRTRDPAAIRNEIQRISRQGEGSNAPASGSVKRKKLLEASLDVALKKQQESVVESKPHKKSAKRIKSTRYDTSRDPTESVYYHPTLNPFGAPPPGMPERYKSNDNDPKPINSIPNSSNRRPVPKGPVPLKRKLLCIPAPPAETDVIPPPPPPRRGSPPPPPPGLPPRQQQVVEEFDEEEFEDSDETDNSVEFLRRIEALKESLKPKPVEEKVEIEEEAPKMEYNMASAMVPTALRVRKEGSAVSGPKAAALPRQVVTSTKVPRPAAVAANPVLPLKKEDDMDASFSAFMGEMKELGALDDDTSK